MKDIEYPDNCATNFQVSMAVRIVPSPDWFVGVDGVELCSNDTWVSEKTVPLNPIDAGTDRGYTYTSPKWASRPQETMFHITSQYPNHRANSFYYPELKELPTIGYMKFDLLTDFKKHKNHLDVRHHREPGEIPQLEEDLEKKREEDEEQQILHGEPLLPVDDSKPAKPKTLINSIEPKLPRDQQSRQDKSSEKVTHLTKHKKHIKPKPGSSTVPPAKKTNENVRYDQTKNSVQFNGKTKFHKNSSDQNRKGNKC